MVHSPVEGDQPSLLIGLVDWARMLGLPVVCAGKSSASDFVWDPQAETVTALGRSVPARDFGRLFAPSGVEAPGLDALRADHGARSLRNGYRREPHRLAAGPAHAACAGRVDMFNCLRRPDELSFAGGVFVVVEAPDPATGRLFAAKGIPTCPDGRYVMLHNPVHLLGAEAAMSMLSAVQFGCSTGGTTVRPVVDLVATASRDLEPGEVLAMGARHVVDGLDHALQPAEKLNESSRLPYYLAVGGRIRRPVRRGEPLRCADVDLRADSVLLQLRQAQDRNFCARGPAGS